MRMLKLTWITLLLFLSSACAWQPTTYSEKSEEAVNHALAEFREETLLEPFFEDAVAYVVFPTSVRAGTGFGGAYGTGWLLEEGKVTGGATMFEFFAGANIGAQAYLSFLFFRSDQSLRRFKRGRFEFTGQANMAHVVGGKAATPGYHPDAAMFVEVKGGLLLEASVGAQRYDYFPSLGNE